MHNRQRTAQWQGQRSANDKRWWYKQHLKRIFWVIFNFKMMNFQKNYSCRSGKQVAVRVFNAFHMALNHSFESVTDAFKYAIWNFYVTSGTKQNCDFFVQVAWHRNNVARIWRTNGRSVCENNDCFQTSFNQVSSRLKSRGQNEVKSFFVLKP